MPADKITISIILSLPKYIHVPAKNTILAYVGNHVVLSAIFNMKPIPKKRTKNKGMAIIN